MLRTYVSQYLFVPVPMCSSTGTHRYSETYDSRYLCVPVPNPNPMLKRETHGQENMGIGKHRDDPDWIIGIDWNIGINWNVGTEQNIIPSKQFSLTFS